MCYLGIVCPHLFSPSVVSPNGIPMKAYTSLSVNCVGRMEPCSLPTPGTVTQGPVRQSNIPEA